jgi:hypothetical protein
MRTLKVKMSGRVPRVYFARYVVHRLRGDDDSSTLREGMRMQVRLSRLSLLGLSVAVLMSARVAVAQSSDNALPAALTGVLLLCLIVFGLACYIYMSLALQTIATKTGAENAWLAWIPIANLILMLNVAKKPLWWILLFFIPIVNIVMAILVWMAVAEARGKPNWWGILMIVPVVNLFVPGYLAWSD